MIEQMCYSIFFTVIKLKLMDNSKCTLLLSSEISFTASVTPKTAAETQDYFSFSVNKTTTY